MTDQLNTYLTVPPTAKQQSFNIKYNIYLHISLLHIWLYGEEIYVRNREARNDYLNDLTMCLQLHSD